MLLYCLSRRIPHTTFTPLSNRRLPRTVVTVSNPRGFNLAQFSSVQLSSAKLPRLSLFTCLRDVNEMKRSGTSVQLANIKGVEKLKRLLWSQ